jgi:hypothetical protein
VVFGCGTDSCGKDSSTHEFPEDGRRRQWIQFVQTTRKDFTGPTENSVVCGRHFATDCFANFAEVDYKKRFLGQRIRLVLFASAVPTIVPEECIAAAKRKVSAEKIVELAAKEESSRRRGKRCFRREAMKVS